MSHWYQIFVAIMILAGFVYGIVKGVNGQTSSGVVALSVIFSMLYSAFYIYALNCGGFWG